MTQEERQRLAIAIMHLGNMIQIIDVLLIENAKAHPHACSACRHLIGQALDYHVLEASALAESKT